jgi:hypothetical protein
MLVVAALIVAYAFFRCGSADDPKNDDACATCGEPQMVVAERVPSECKDLEPKYFGSKPSWPPDGGRIGLPEPQKIEALCQRDEFKRCYSTIEGEETDHLYTTGLALAPVACSPNSDGDGSCQYKDIIISNGNDKQEQRVYLLDNLGGNVDGGVDWYSCDRGYHGNLAAGDYDNDGDVDIAVATMFGPGSQLDSGFIKLYENTGSGLERCPTTIGRKENEEDDGIGVVVGVAFGDANADGRLDLFAAVGGSLKQDGEGNMPYLKTAPSVLFLNDSDASRRFNTAVYTEKKHHAGDAEFSDINGDGLMDLVLAARHATVHFGEVMFAGNVTIPFDANSNPWESEQKRRGSYAVAIGGHRVDERLPVAWAANAIKKESGVSDKPQKFRLYLPRDPESSDATPDDDKLRWRSRSEGSNSKILLADLDDDGKDDLIATRWAPELGSIEGAAIRIYGGVAAAGAERTPDYCSNDFKPVAQEVALADLDRDDIEEGTPIVVGGKGGGPRVVTIPGRVERIVGVEDRDGDPLLPEEYAHVPGENWVSFDDTRSRIGLRIFYETSTAPDMVINDWSRESSVSIFEHGVSPRRTR